MSIAGARKCLLYVHKSIKALKSIIISSSSSIYSVIFYLKVENTAKPG